MTRTRIFSLLFVLGYLALSFEILAIRLFTPFYGAGTEQTSILIGVVLLSTSLGNFRGGKLLALLGLNSALILMAIGSGFFLTHPFLYAQKQVLQFVPPYLAIAISAVISLAPLSFLTGSFFTYLLKSGEDLKISLPLGSMIAASTLGAFVGSVGTSLILTYVLSAGETIILNTSLIIFTIGIYRAKNLLVLLLILPVIYFNTKFTKNFVEWETGVSTYDVLETDAVKNFVVNGVSGSSLIFPDGSGPAYVRILDQEILDNPKPLSVLCLGAGGMSLSLKNRHHDYTYVDLDPKLPQIIRKSFNPDPKGSLVVADAREFLLKSGEKYDLIVQDVFHADTSVPLHLLTLEHFLQARKRLKPDGFFAINLSHKGSFYHFSEARRVTGTVEKAFGPCLAIPFNGKPLHLKDESYRQTLLICRNTDSKPRLLRDDRY